MAMRQNNTKQLVDLNREDASSWVAMIVDDEQDNLDVISRLLEFLGAKVITAYNGVEALELLETQKPTFILSDFIMPDMDGKKLLKRINEKEGCEDIPIILVTASTMTVDSIIAKRFGFDGFIAKPFGISGFVTEIRRCLKDSSKPAGVA